MLLDRGRLYRWRRPSAGMAPMLPRACWQNTFTLHQTMGWGYAVGLASTKPWHPPTQHAWAVDGHGKAVDLTWWGRMEVAVNSSTNVTVDFTKQKRRVYFGLVLSLEDMLDCLPAVDAFTPLERYARKLGYRWEPPQRTRGRDQRPESSAA